MVLALLQKLLARPISTIGQIGQKYWKVGSLLLIMAFIIIAVGLIGVRMARASVLRNLVPVSLRFPRLTRDHGLLPRNRVNTSGASKIAGTTSVPEPKDPGLESSSHSATNHSTRLFARKHRRPARSRPSIFRRHRTESPVTSSGSSSGEIQDCLEPFDQPAPVACNRNWHHRCPALLL